MTLPNELLLIANLLGAPVGCGALKVHFDTQIAEVKRMWVASDVRGLGLGRRLLERSAATSDVRELLGRSRRPPLRWHTPAALRYGLPVGCLKQLPDPVFQQSDGLLQGAE